MNQIQKVLAIFLVIITVVFVVYLIISDIRINNLRREINDRDLQIRYLEGYLDGTNHQQNENLTNLKFRYPGHSEYIELD